ncbi:hypothetical protein [Agrobacterium rosae]|uniref:Uncharacterized protein n=1 Tax=Agrobacterium rosae TaxID=1972867 RepID=A0AAW9FJM0_9HYPH|nr:hypothetical protein [Agrobacterium rosae]MDX8303802.1 hypothetical protein [Agrobacterium rosae]POO56743.1 hypothetical protein CTT39_08705 [Agrobacterium rosae]
MCDQCVIAHGQLRSVIDGVVVITVQDKHLTVIDFANLERITGQRAGSSLLRLGRRSRYQRPVLTLRGKLSVAVQECDAHHDAYEHAQQRYEYQA